MNTIVVCICSMLLVQPGAATRPAQNEIPRDLAATFLAAANMDTTELRVGILPTGFPSAIIPTDSRVLGGLQGSTRNIAVLAFAGDYPSARNTLGVSLEARGWRPVVYAARPSPGFGSAAPVTPQGGRGGLRTPEFYCYDTQTIQISQSRSASVGSVVVLTHSRGSASPPCVPEGDRSEPTSPVPPLIYPAGVQGTGPGGSSSGGNEFRSYAQARTALPLPELVSQFASQLRNAGWTDIDSSASDKMASRTMHITTASNESWLLLLSAYLETGSADVQLLLNARKKR